MRNDRELTAPFEKLDQVRTLDGYIGQVAAAMAHLHENKPVAAYKTLHYLSGELVKQKALIKA